MIEQANLPKRWIELPLLNIAEVYTGKKDANFASLDGEYKFFTCAFEPLNSSSYSFEGEVLILPGNGANVGEVFYYSGKFEAYQRTYVVAKIQINPKFLFYYFKAFWKKKGVAEQFGSATNYIKIGNFKNFTVYLPPRPEQDRIVAKVDALMTQVETMERSLERIPQLLKDFRQQVLTQAVTGKLIGKNKFTTLGKLEVSIKTGPFGSALHKSEYIKNGIPIINPSHIKNGEIRPNKNVTITKIKAKELQRWILKPNDVILGRRGEMGRCALYIEGRDPMICGTGSVVLKGNDRVSAKFLDFYLRSEFCVKYLESNSVGSTMINLNQKILKSVPFPDMTLVEQKQSIKHLSNLFTKADTIEKQYKTLKIKIDTLPQAILHKAFKGELIEQLASDGDARELLWEIEGLRNITK